MSERVPIDVELLACETCGSAERAALGSTRGERLLAALRDAVAEGGITDVTVTGVKCLWSCKRSCSVHVRGRRRAGYVLCDLEPNAESARALLDYAALYRESVDGAVPYKQWPQPLRGHFLCRVPAAPEPACTERNE